MAESKRRSPTQARAAATVDAILEASLQLLDADGAAASKLTADIYGATAKELYYDTYLGPQPAVQFMSGSAVKTGGSVPLVTGVGSGRSAILAYDYADSNQRILQVYLGGSPNSGGN